jgi:hypothetical protein
MCLDIEHAIKVTLVNRVQQQPENDFINFRACKNAEYFKKNNLIVGQYRFAVLKVSVFLA